MARHEDIGVQSLHGVQYSNPRDTVAARHIRKFFVKENFAHVCDPVLRDKKDAVSLRVCGAEM